MAVNNVKNPAAVPAKADVLSAIRQASQRTGVDFNYLLQNAAAESSLNPAAHSASSSAHGLYQFIESTWLDTVDKHGAEHGLQKAAAAITRNASGKPVVNDSATRQQILALRDNPRIAALMAAEFTKDNRAVLETTLGRPVDNNELYMAHFLGASGAGKLLTEGAAAPDMPAATLLPQAAQANAAIFTDGGHALAVNDMKSRLVQHFTGSLDGMGMKALAQSGTLHDLALAVGDEKSAVAITASIKPTRSTAQSAQTALALQLLKSMSITESDGQNGNRWEA